jgi:hypothetical protein
MLVDPVDAAWLGRTGSSPPGRAGDFGIRCDRRRCRRATRLGDVHDRVHAAGDPILLRAMTPHTSAASSRPDERSRLCTLA